MSAFNGIESMVEKLYSEFDSDLTIRSKNGKTFDEHQIDFKKLAKLPGIASYSRAVEEIVVLKNEKKWVNSHLVGVDSTFLSMTNMENHIVDGDAMLKQNNEEFGIIGASLLDNLGGYIPDKIGYETLLFYIPKRNAKVRLGSNPFTTRNIKISGRINYNREVNADVVILPIRLAKELLDYDRDITSVYVQVKEGETNEDVKIQIQQLLGGDFEVKTNYEKNELIYKTSKSEKLIVLFILIFIFILAAFNLVASLTMLFIEKMDNIKTMISYGANKQLVFRIFFYEGLMISFKGVIWGLLIGYAICAAQLFAHPLMMPNSGDEPFPIKLTFVDGLFIVGLVSTLSVIASYLPVRYLIKRNFDSNSF